MRLMFHAPLTRLFPSRRAGRLLMDALGCAALLVAVAACAPAASGSVSRRTAPIARATTTPTPTITPTVTPTVTPTPLPTAVPPAPKAPPPAPPILDVRPASMSIVGHLDCARNGVYVCQAEVLAPASNQIDLNWRAFTNVPGGITFSPSNGALAPGHMLLITIRVPFNACASGLFFFRGPANTHTIAWAC